MTPIAAAPVRPLGHSLCRAGRALGVALSVLGYAILAPVGYGSFMLLCWLWRDRPLVAARRMQTCIRVGFRFTLRWLRWVRVADCRYEEAAAKVPDGPCVVVANHPTQLDVVAVGACLGLASTIVKSRVFRRRLVRPMLVGAGMLEGPGTDPISVGRVIEDGVQRLRDGMRIYVFPEGSRSLPEGLRPFGRVAFEIACRAGVPLVTLGIRCRPVYLSREVPLFCPPSPMPRHRVELLAIERPADFGGDSRALREAVERRLRAWCAADAPATEQPFAE